MITPIFTAGECIGVTIDGTAHSEAGLLALLARLALMQAELAERESDLEYEYTARMVAESRCEAWYEVATFHADHASDCLATPGFAEACTCGYSRCISRAIQADYDAAKPTPATTPHARIAALGRATLAYERAKATRNAEGRDVDTQAAPQAVVAARRAWVLALAEAMKGGEG